ncbi:hypothetical protein BASA81_003252 [Batrachochytrium salamandrivorans]|nr:hypothetical protein BASA81_003252 [Batrachochytrium salamandrivorans]
MNDLDRAIASGNVSAPMEEEEGTGSVFFSATSREAMEKHAQSLKQFETKQRQRLVDVPTNDLEVKQLLRLHSQPICLFGERDLDRRERLKRVVAEIQVNLEASGVASAAAAAVKPSLPTSSSQYSRNKKAFYTPAGDALIVARQAIAVESWRLAKLRIAKESKEEEELPDTTTQLINYSQVATLNEPRPISTCAFSPSASRIVTGSFDHKVRVYDVNNQYKLERTLVGHENRVCDARFATNNELVICSGSAEGQVRVWKGSETCSVLSGHVSRVGRLAPFAGYLVSTSFDRTFRLWDLNQETCLLLQDGHSREVYACAVHPDQSLVCTTDLGGITRVWDLRSANTTHVFMGHTLGVLACDFHPNGWLLATSSLDNSARVWDLRQSKSLAVLPCHLQPVTSCKFDPMHASRLITASHDRSVAVWDFNSKRRLANLPKLHQGPVLNMDVAGSTNMVATVGYDRSAKFLQLPSSSI